MVTQRVRAERLMMIHVCHRLDDAMNKYKRAKHRTRVDKLPLDPLARTNNMNDLCESFTEIQEIVKEYPEVVAQVDIGHPDQVTFLIKACMPKLRFSPVCSDLVNMFVKANPGAASMTDLMGNTPLLRYCHEYNLDRRVVELLIDANPKAVQSCNNEQMLPLHAICDYSAPSKDSLDVIEMVMGLYPEALKTTDTRHETPLHKLCNRSNFRQFDVTYLGLLRKMIDAFPGALRMRCQRGRIPLYIVSWKQMSELNIDAMSLLMNKAPDTIAYGNNENNTPFHMAARGRYHTMMKCMIKLCPAALKTHNKQGNTPLSLYVSTCRLLTNRTALSTNTLCLMIDAWPVATLLKDEYDKIPCNLMECTEMDEEAVYALSAATKQSFSALVVTILDDTFQAGAALKDLVCKKFPALVQKHGIVNWQTIQLLNVSMSMICDIVTKDVVQDWLRMEKVDDHVCRVIKMIGSDNMNPSDDHK